MSTAPRRRTRAAVLAALLVALAATGLVGCSSGPTFTNPIRATGQDPYVLEVDHHYLLVETRDDGIWIVQSAKDDLTGIGAHHTDVHVFTQPASGKNCAGLWAPELHHLDGRWYVYYAATTCDGNNANHRMFVLQSTSDDPLGSYRDLGQIGDSSDHWAIDGTVLDVAGHRYFVWSGWPGTQDGQQNLYAAEMSSPTTVSGPRVLISSPDKVWEQRTAAIEEGPEVLTHNGRVFLVYSASASWTDDYAYGLLELRGSDPLDRDAWVKSPEPVFSKTSTVFGPGHGSFVKSPDGSQDWMVYHSAIATGTGWLRHIDAQRFTWHADGSPDFGVPVAPGVEMPLPAGRASD